MFDDDKSVVLLLLYVFQFGFTALLFFFFFFPDVLIWTKFSLIGVGTLEERVEQDERKKYL